MKVGIFYILQTSPRTNNLFVIVPGILHLWNENLNLDVILNEAFLLRNKKIGIEYCNINNEFI